MSLDLLGVLPTQAELDAVEADLAMLDEGSTTRCPTPLDRATGPHLGRTWHTQVDESQLLFKEYDNLYLDDANEYPFERSAGEELLRLGVRRLQRSALV